ncbi:translocation protein SEC63 [Nematocida displodere]|uniref:Translocation protein SEC63 n=1 Tax=Nematocida displodere TaxID=1805483 RepID=A0A177EC43_9MICR|nr:translocation protein SEC63 [Nematocida displodere]
MSSKYEYDASGVSSSLLAIVLLVPVIAITYSRAFPPKKTLPAPCRCQECVKLKEERRGFNIYRIIFLCACALIALPIKNAIMGKYERTGAFDPYDVLSLDTSATDQDVLTAYRSLVRETKMNREDKRAQNEKVQKILRAKDLLLDHAKRESWDAFGEGEVGKSHVIAIPEWALSQNSAILIILIYISLLGIALPKVVSYLWKFSFDYSAVGISYRTAESLFHQMKHVKKCSTIYTLIEWITQSSTEMAEHAWKTPQANLDRLQRILSADLAISTAPGLASARHVLSLSALALKNEQVLTLIDNSDLSKIQEELLNGAMAVRLISQHLKQKEIFYLTFDLERCLVLSIPEPKYSELQYPDTHFPDVFIKAFEGKKYDVEHSEIDKEIDQNMFKAKIVAIDMYTAVDGPITKGEVITGSAECSLRVVLVREGHASQYLPPTPLKVSAPVDTEDLSIFTDEECPEISPKELEKSPIVIRGSVDSVSAHNPLFYAPQKYTWSVVLEVNGVLITESSGFTPGVADTEVLFKLPSFQSLTHSKKAVVDVHLVCTKFFNRDTLFRKTLILR